VSLTCVQDWVQTYVMFSMSFSSLHNEIGLFSSVVMGRVAVPPRCVQIVV